MSGNWLYATFNYWGITSCGYSKIDRVAMGINSLDAYATKDGFLHILYLLEQVGWSGIGLVNTVLAGFIAFSIADKPAIGAGLIGGALASNTKAGFFRSCYCCVYRWIYCKMG